MTYSKRIGQVIVSGNTRPNTNLVTNENIVQLGIYTLPGSIVFFDENNQGIVINQTGLLQIEDLPIQLGIKSITVPQETVNLLAAAGAQMVIDYVSMFEEVEV